MFTYPHQTAPGFLSEVFNLPILTFQLAQQMDEKFKKQFPTRKELEIVSSTREWKKLDNAARVIQRFFKIYQMAISREII